jgi:hypothetical protein
MRSSLPSDLRISSRAAGSGCFLPGGGIFCLSSLSKTLTHRLNESASFGFQARSAQARFDDAKTFDYYGVLVIGRSIRLKPLERDRLDWRRQRVIVDSRHVHCLTFDEFYDDFAFKLEKYSHAAAADRGKSPA